MIYRSHYPHVPIPERPLADYILENAARYADKPAIIEGLTGRTLTYRELVDGVRRTAGGLAGHGFRKGNVCAIYSPNVPEYAIAFLGVALAGGVVTTVNPLYTVTELAHQLRDSDARLLVTTPQLLQVSRHGSKQAGIEQIFTFGEGDGATPFSSLMEHDDRFEPVGIDARNDLAVLPYSSGTTGLPKGVMLTHFNIVANVLQIESAEKTESREVVLATLPFYHIYGMVVVMNVSLHVGATVVTMPSFEVKTFLEMIQRYRVTTAYVVPPLVRTLAKHPLVDRYDRSSLRHVVSGAAPLPEAIAKACADRNDCIVRQAYGLTETSSVTHLTPRHSARMEPVGQVLPNTEFRIVDVAARQDMPPGELGEVWIRGPQVMKGYLNNPEATAQMIDPEGWLHTGDIGHIDKDGYLYVVDRAKELIKFRGLHYAEHELLLAMVEDIAIRRQATNRLNFQAHVLDSVRESVVATDLRHRVILWNKGAEALFGYRAEEAVGRSINELILPIDDATRAHREVELADLELQGHWKGETPRRRKDGSPLWTDLFVSTIYDADGQPSGFVAIHRDITEVRRDREMIRDAGERMRNLASRLMEIREQERASIARELHDQLGQALTRLNIDLCWLGARLPKYLRTKRVRSMVSIVEKMLETVHHISSELRPAILDDLGLEAALEWQVQEFVDWNGGRSKLDLKMHDLKPNGERDTAVFRIVQEALTNVARHAHANLLTVRGRVSDGELIVEVEDDGVGLPESKLLSPRSLGLIGMRERAEAVRGRLDCTRRTTGGTVVAVRVPLEENAREVAQG
jgi:PAS domain S-box-containing protein